MAMERDGLTAQLARLVANSPHADYSPGALHGAKRAFIDTLGVMIAGRNAPAVRQLDTVFSDGAEASALPGSRLLSARDAALLGGTAGHVLDYDDVAMHGHASVVLIPAILSEAQRGSASGRAALQAYLVGFEVWSELARREPDSYHLGSWHPTTTLGTVAACAAVAALNTLDEDRARHALAISASFASGVIANFGTHTKPLQAGHAAAAAIEAVRFAEAGLQSAADALESPHGLLRGISPEGRVDLASPMRTRPGQWSLADDGVSVKLHPVCYAAHRAIDAVIGLAKKHGLTSANVSKVTVRLGRAPAETLRYANPQDGLQAKFSLHHNVAAALLDGQVGFSQLTDAYVRRSDVTVLYARTVMRISDEDPCPDQPGQARYDRVVIETANGHIHDSGDVRYPRGHARLPLSDAELDAKFLDCAAHGGLADPALLLERLHGLECCHDIAEVFDNGI
jgi:aconitate decarboxylase